MPWNFVFLIGHEHIEDGCVVIGSKYHIYDEYDISDGVLPTVITDSIVLTGSMIPTRIEPYYLSHWTLPYCRSNTTSRFPGYFV